MGRWHVGTCHPAVFAAGMRWLGERYLDDRRGVVRKAAKSLVKALKRG